VSIQYNRINLPDFIIVGAAKGGTTSLYQYLKQHPQVFFPEHKEPYFFSFEEGVTQADDPDFRKLIIDDSVNYSGLFSPATPGQLLGEASTSYLYTHQVSVPKIQRLYQEAGRPLPKMIAILRNPVDRAFSHYVYLRQKGVETLSFEEAIRPDVAKQRHHLRNWDYDYVEYGRYAAQVRHFKQAFPQMRFYIFEDLVSDPMRLVLDLLEYLDLEPFAIDTTFVSNPSGEPTSRAAVHMLIGDTWLKTLARTLVPIDYRDAVRRMRDKLLKRFLRKNCINKRCHEYLIETYRDDIKELQSLLDRDLSSWMYL
jgi:hypothetical protein